MDLSKSFLTPFDPDDAAHNDAPLGFLYAEISGRKQWWLVNLCCAPGCGSKSGENGLLACVIGTAVGHAGDDMVERADDFRGCPWIPLQWPDPEIPEQHLPAYRMTLDCPGGERIACEWGPEPVSKNDQKGIKRIFDYAIRCGDLVEPDRQETP